MRTLFLIFLSASLHAMVHAAGGRHALILCNQNYKIVGELRTPLAEAREAEKTLAALGFTGNITVLTDATTAKMIEAVDTFAAKLTQADVALFFYGGHAIQAAGENYLLGVDSDPSTTSQLAYKALPLGRVLTNLEGSGSRLNLLILDCCRDNPLPATGRSIGSTRGLAAMASAPKGTFIAYAADANQQAWDDHGSIGLYGSVLFEKMKTPGLRLEDIFIQTREEVSKIATEKYQHQQEPAEYSKVSGAFFFVSGVQSALIPTMQQQQAPLADDYTRLAGSTAGEKKMIEVAAGVPIPFRWCPPGSFTMGSSESEKARLIPAGSPEGFYAEEVPHQVTLTRGFWMAETEVTQGQWQAVMGTTLLDQANLMLADDTLYQILDGRTLRDSLGMKKGDGATAIGVESEKLAMYYVNWEDADEFCTKASRHARQRGWAISLPTEAQWEYACRSGTSGMTYAGDFSLLGLNNAPEIDAIAWYSGNSSEGYSGSRGWIMEHFKGRQYSGRVAGVRRVGAKMANAWGLHDMLGNVWEWCADVHGPYQGDATDPTGSSKGANHVVRGGGWSHGADVCRAAYRFGDEPGRRHQYLGFRPALVPSSP